MKKIFTLLASFALVLTLAACETETIIKYIEKEVEVPVEKVVREYIEVEVPYEVEVPVEVILEEEVIVNIPAEVDSERFYKPGVYFNHTEISTDGTYTYSVVVVDRYGKIAGIMFDDTKSTSKFFTNEDEDLYIYIEGDGKTIPNSYRRVDYDINVDDYPTILDAITADDLVVGIHESDIAELTGIEAFETSRILNADWIHESDKLVEKILKDQTTYSVLTSTSGNEVTAVNVDTELTNVDVLLGLVQEVLDGEAALTTDVELATTPVRGLYTPGYKFGSTVRQIDHGRVTYYTSFVVVDDYGRIAGVFNDATINTSTEGERATKWILKEAYGMGSATGNIPWYLQAKGFSDAIVRNQGIDAIKANADYAIDDEDETGHMYTDIIAGTTIGVEGLIESTNDALTQLPLPEYNDGTYFVSGNGEDNHAFMVITVEGGKLESIYLDNTIGKDQATVLRDDEWLPVFTFVKKWEDFNEEETEILVYKDGEDYYPLVDVDYDSDGEIDYEYDDEVEFILDEENEIDEFATLKPVVGNYTKQMLQERYGMNQDNPWYEQANTLAKAFVDNGVYGINLNDDGYTDVTGVTFSNIGDYQQLLIDALLQASSEKASDKALYVNSDSHSMELMRGPINVLADGTYFASSETDTKGQQTFAWMNVVDGEIETLVFDSTISRDELITTKNSLGYDYGMAEDEDQLEWFEQAAIYAKTVIDNQRNLISIIENGYDFEDPDTYTQLDLETSITPETDFDAIDTTAGVSISADNFKQLTEVLIQQALAQRVDEQANTIFKAITDLEYEFVVGDEDFTPISDRRILMSPLALNLPSYYFIDLRIGDGAEFTHEWETSDDDIIDLTNSDTTWQIEDVEVDSEVVMTLILEYGDFEFTKDFIVPVKTFKSAKLDTLADFELDFDTIIDTYRLRLPYSEGVHWKITSPETTSGVINSSSSISAISMPSDYVFIPQDVVEGDNEVYTLTAWFDTEETPNGSFEKTDVYKEFTITVIDESDAVEAAVKSLKPGNILKNVTASEITGLTYKSDVGGLSFSWQSDDRAVRVTPIYETLDPEDIGPVPRPLFGPINIKVGEKLLIDRYADKNEEVELTGRVHVNDSLDVAGSKTFKFSLTKKTEEQVQKEINDTLNTINLPNYVDATNSSSGVIAINALDLITNKATSTVLAENVDVTWKVTDPASKEFIEVSDSGDLVFKKRVTETVTVKIVAEGEVTVDSSDTKVEASREYEIILFKN